MDRVARTRGRVADQSILKCAGHLFIDVGRYPTQSEGLRALVEAPSGARSWSGPYLRGGAVPLDPWGQEYRYSADGGSYTIVTMGPDGVGATQ
ncbi:type II secretion system protein GspG [Neoaquamicrobium sediminum]|uniref:type II secretion system protein GspG n=1 Tax=Neoaquamicrobium sediminum TaxID=1849104 RepID=UPI0028ADF892|nr:type II secretion system protein GspG [Mesorhizobium sediminum]